MADLFHQIPVRVFRASVVVPAFNEEAVIEKFYAEVVRVLDTCSGFEFKILFVDDGSSDSTVQGLSAIIQDEKEDDKNNYSRFFHKNPPEA